MPRLGRGGRDSSPESPLAVSMAVVSDTVDLALGPEELEIVSTMEEYKGCCRR